MKISLFIVACIIFIVAPVVMSGKADMLIPGLKRMYPGTLSKSDLRGIRIVSGIEYMLISGATLAVALYPSWATLLAAALFILVTIFSRLPVCKNILSCQVHHWRCHCVCSRLRVNANSFLSEE